MTCQIVIGRCKPPSAAKLWGVNWTLEFARRWQPNTPYDIGVAVRPNTRGQTGFQYVSSGGVSAGSKRGKPEPVWPSTGTVQDGSILWTPQPISNDSLEERIVSEDWTVPAGIVVTPQSFIDQPGMQASAAMFSGGTSRQIYLVRVDVTTTIGAVHSATFRVSIS